MLKKIAGVPLIAFLAGNVWATSLVFDLDTLSLSLPDVTVGTAKYNIVLKYEADGRLSITSLTPISDTSSGGSCTLTYQDYQGQMTLTMSKVTRPDPTQPSSTPVPYYKLVGQVVSGTPWFCPYSHLTVAQGGRQLSNSAFRLDSDTVGTDSGYEDCGTFQPNTQTILYRKISSVTNSAAWFDPNAAFTLTIDPAGGDDVSVNCSL